MENQQKTTKKPFLGRLEKKAIFWLIIIIGSTLLLTNLWNSSSSTVSKSETKVNYDTLKSIVHLVIFEQEFVVTDHAEKSKKYFGVDLLTTKEQVFTTASGKMQFYLNLAERTQLIDHGDYLEVQTSIAVDKPNIALSSIKQVKDASLDPTLEVDQQAILSRLDTLAMMQHLPTMLAAVKGASLYKPEAVLSQLAGKPVKIVFTEDPPIMQVINDLKL